MYSQQFCKDASFVLGDRNFILDTRRIFLFIKTCGPVEFQLNASLLNWNRTQLLPPYWNRIKSAILWRHCPFIVSFQPRIAEHCFCAERAIEWHILFQSSRPSIKRHPWEWLCSISVPFQIISDAWAFHTNVVIFWYPWESLYHKCCRKIRAWIYHSTHSLALSLRTFRIVNALACLIVLSRSLSLFSYHFSFFFYLLLLLFCFFLLSYLALLLPPSSLFTYMFLIFFST